MKEVLSLFFFLSFLTTQICECGFTFKSDIATDLDQYFEPQQQGWLGADVSMSLLLNNNTYLWLWGDTLFGRLQTDATGHTKRARTAMPHSSIAFVNMSGDKKPKYWIRPGPDPMGTFTPQKPTDPQEYYWIPEGIMSAKFKQLIVIAQVIVNGNGGFSQIGTDAILVTNPLEDPSQWKYITSRIPSSSKELSWNSGIGFEPSSGYFYLLGLRTGHAYLARILEADMIKLNWNNMEYWSVGSVWSKNVDSLLSLYESVYTEGTLIWHPYMQQWYTILCQAYRSNIDIVYAPSVTGPWSRTTVYTIPSPYTNGTYITYAGKAHPEYETKPNEIVFTYNINSPSDDVVNRDLTTYHPRFIRLTITKN